MTIQENNAAKLAAAKKHLGVYWLGHPNAIQPAERRRLEKRKLREHKELAEKMRNKFLSRQA